MRATLPSEQIASDALKAMADFHPETLKELTEALRANEWVIVGMGWNPFVGKARKFLEAKGKTCKYLGYGNYLSGWKIRLAIKLWSGWPTFPQVFHKGKLIGGYTDLTRYLK